MAPTAFLATFDESAFTQHRQMTRDGRLIALHEDLEVANADLLVADTAQELETRRIG